jgi:hypothetical protein
MVPRLHPAESEAIALRSNVSADVLRSSAASRSTRGEQFIECPTCGHTIDMWDLAEGREHEGPHLSPSMN